MIRFLKKQNLEEADVVQRLSFPNDLHEDMSLFARILDQDNSIGYSYYSDNQMSGYILGYPTLRSRMHFQSGPEPCLSADMMYLHDLCVHPDFQGRGVGQALFQAFRDKAKEYGYQGILATAISGRLSYWERFGFEVAGDSSYRGVKSTRVELCF